ncbi:MAG: Peptidyl-prolyl cis-trans isomerase-like 1 [Candidatus Parcubacteria bacterium]
MTAGIAYVASQPGSTKELELVATPDTPPLEAPLVPKELDVTQPERQNTMNPIAVLTTNKGVIEIELYKDVMPITAGNFEKLVNEGFYNGVKFHRVIDGFMIQGGDPLTKDDAATARWGTGGPGYAIADEHIAGEKLSNTRGSISMANSGPNSGGSQFFINLVDNTPLDFDKQPLSSKHPVFGRVVKGIEVVDAIGKVAVGLRDVPVEPVVIESATIVNPQ